jgi:hypothetical protein
MTSQKAYGWQKIADVSATRFLDQTGRTVDAYVEIKTTNGGWFLVSLKKNDPEPEELAERYRVRGWTDARCLYMGEAK